MVAPTPRWSHFLKNALDAPIATSMADPQSTVTPTASETSPLISSTPSSPSNLLSPGAFKKTWLHHRKQGRHEDAT